jgi:hypothetical protein
MKMQPMFICGIVVLGYLLILGIGTGVAAGVSDDTTLVEMTDGPLRFVYPESWDFSFNHSSQSYRSPLRDLPSYVSITYLNQTGDFQGYVIEQKEALNTSFSNFSESEFIETTVSGYPAYHRVFHADSFSGKGFIEDIWYLDLSEYYAVAQYLSYPDDYDLVVDQFLDLVQTISSSYHIDGE